MKIRSTFSKKMAWRTTGSTLLIALVALAMHSQPLLAAGTALAPGDIVFTGYLTNGVPTDTFSFVTLAPLDAGTVIYFTDNGWTGTGFRTITDTSASGKESITRLTINSAIAAGTVIRSDDVSSSFTWDTSSPIPAGSQYSTIGLSQDGDQIMAVQSTNSSNPLFSGFTALAQIDYTGGFEPAINNNTGDLLPGLSQATGTALLFNNLATYAAFTLTSLTSGTPSAWRTAIADQANWTFNTTGTSLPTGTVAVVSGASISAQPSAQIIIISTTATLSVVATGSPPPSYQWYQGNSGDISNPITGATAASFTTSALSATTSYWVRVSNSDRSVDSITATITVIDPALLTEKSYLPIVNK